MPRQSFRRLPSMSSSTRGCTSLRSRSSRQVHRRGCPGFLARGSSRSSSERPPRGIGRR
ncbi:hypothetical protein ACFPRL_07060 [Pseudoclavibacter helvolus]